jgi:protein-tyrosine phosphatase
MRATLDSITTAHHTVRGYLHAHGMTDGEFDDLRSALVA